MVFASLLLKMVDQHWCTAAALDSDQDRLAEQMLSFHSLNLSHSLLSPCFTVTCLVFNPGVLILLPLLLSSVFYINIKITYFFHLHLRFVSYIFLDSPNAYVLEFPCGSRMTLH